MVGTTVPQEIPERVIKNLLGGGMAPRRQAWTLGETTLLIKNYDRPIQELLEMFPRHSQSSIDRKLSRLREDRKIGFKSEETKLKAYQLRGKDSQSIQNN